MSNASAITVSVLGGGGEVGANCFHLSIGGQTLLLDCGTHPKKEGYEALPAFALLRRSPDALLISHSHVDHCGAMPYLHRQFPEVKTYATIPTVRTMDRMLHNSVAVMETIAKERNIIEYPLYEHADVTQAMRRVFGFEMGQPFTVDDHSNIEIQFQHAGHVLGSASILLRCDGHTIFYTGDICDTNQELMDGYAPLPDDVKVDTLFIESTHGATEREGAGTYKAEADALGQCAAKVLNNGGAVLIPSFALGRTQEILNVIARMQDEGVVPDVPVYASGLGRAIYELYAKFPEYLGKHAELRSLEQFGRLRNAFDTTAVEALISEPCIIVATSGMMLENTPSALIAEAMVRHKHHGIFFVGYLDQDTLGYKLLNAKLGEMLRFRLGYPPVEVQLENIRRLHFSAHAPRAALARIIQRLHPKNIVYIHGDPEALEWMRANTGNGAVSYAPTIGQTITLEA